MYSQFDPFAGRSLRADMRRSQPPPIDPPKVCTNPALPNSRPRVLRGSASTPNCPRSTKERSHGYQRVVDPLWTTFQNRTTVGLTTRVSAVFITTTEQGTPS